MTCSNCHTDEARRRGLCDACYMHHRRTGDPRPETNIIRLNIRRFDEEAAARRRRA